MKGHERTGHWENKGEDRRILIEEVKRLGEDKRGQEIRRGQETRRGHERTGD